MTARGFGINSSPHGSIARPPVALSRQIGAKAPGILSMPYFVYKITPPRELTHVVTLERYQAARAEVRSLRQDAEAGVEYRLIFAKQMGEAEKLLSTPRDERVIGED